MKKLKALFTSIILILVILSNLMPIISFAADDTSTDNKEQEEIGRVYEIKEEETWDVSKNQDGSVIAKWTLNNKTLTISGSGDMKDWKYSSSGDWHSSQYTNIIEKVIIENGITNIGKCEFYECVSLTNIIIPSSVTSIEEEAFYGCSSLKNIELPNSISRIKDSTFCGCSSLENIEIPESITGIKSSAFRNCNSLTNIKLSDNVSLIENYVFDGCSNLAKIEVDPNNSRYVSEDGVLFNLKRNTLLKYPANKVGKTYSIPETVTNIGESAFNGCNNLENIEIPSSVTNIEGFAFNGCFNLGNINIPNNVTEIGNYAFSDCKGPILCKTNSMAHLYSENVGKGYILLDNVSSTYTRDYQIKEEETWNISNYGNVTAKFTAKDRTLRISGRGEIKSWDTSLKEDWHNTQYTNLIEKVIIEDGIVNIGSYTFYECKYLKSIQISNSVTILEHHAFSNCSSLDNVIIPNRVSVLSIGLFFDCSSLANIEIPNSVTMIKDYAFSECSSLKTLNIPKSVKYIENAAFYKCNSLSNINVDEFNSKFVSKNGGLYDKSETKLIKHANIEDYYSISNKVTSISPYAFSGCDKLKKIELPNSIEYIGSGAFEGCKELTSIILPDSVKSIESYVFCDCYKLENIYIPNSVTLISNYAFWNCKRLANIEISNKVKFIGQNTFLRCKGPIICKKDSAVHKYSENNKIGYVLNANPIRLEVKCTPNGITHEKVIVTILSDTQLQPVEGWTLSEDEFKLTKEYSKNVTEEVAIKDLVGNETKITVIVNNIVDIGDINLNSQIDIGDILLLLRHMAQVNSSEVASIHPDWKLSEEKIKIGDVNKNNQIDIGDILQLQRYISAKNSKDVASIHPEWINL